MLRMCMSFLCIAIQINLKKNNHYLIYVSCWIIIPTAIKIDFSIKIWNFPKQIGISKPKWNLIIRFICAHVCTVCVYVTISNNKIRELTYIFRSTHKHNANKMRNWSVIKKNTHDAFVLLSSSVGGGGRKIVEMTMSYYKTFSYYDNNKLFLVVLQIN